MLLRSLLLSLAVISPFTQSSIMKPETSMVLINEEEGGGSINITNTSDTEALLYVKVYDLPDDKEPQILVTQPVSRIAAGQTQRVRFILNQDKPLQHQHMKRVIFEGIPPQTASGANSIGMNIRQDLPVIIHPAALEMSADPWKALKWTQRGTTLTVTNPSDMVVRLAQEIELLPLRRKLKLSKSYILPGQSLNVTLPESAGVQSGRQVQIQTLSKYGYVAGKFKQPVSLAS
nr:fimbria/pilus chaperone family protein [uncultured Erwinia sp.]